MKELATPTGDVYKNWDIREDEKIYFLQCKENEFTIGLGDLLNSFLSPVRTQDILLYEV